MKFILSLSLLLSVLSFASCSDESEDIQISISKTSIKVGANTGSEKVTLTSNADWRTVISQNWVTVTPSSGKAGNTEVSVSYSANLSGQKRTASIVFSAGDKTSIIALEQDIQTMLQLPAKNYTIDYKGGVVTVVSDQKYQATVPVDVDWISFSEAGDVLKMTVAGNSMGEERVCKVIFKNTATNGLLETLVIQKAASATNQLLQLKTLKIDDIPCIIDQGTLQIYFPVDMDLSSPKLNHKVSFEGIGIEYLRIDGTDKKIYSGDYVTFSKFEAKTSLIFKAGNSLLDEEKSSILNITGLPLVSINAPQGIVDSPKHPCDMIIIDPKGRTNGNKVYYETHAGIEWRGSGALRYVKKAYGFKLWEDGTETSKDASLLGLREDNNWILDAMWLDKARMRNRVLFDIWNEFSKPYYIASEPKAENGTHGYLVEVFLDGKYHGLYALSDKLDRKQLKLKKEGGYLYKVTGWSDECLLRGITSPYNNNSLVWNEVEMDYPDEIGKVEFKYYNNLIKFVTETTPQEFSAKFEEVIDMASMVDHFLYTNLFYGYDNIGRNTYWAIYDVNKSEKMIPLIWDLDGTLGRTWDRQIEDPEGGFLIYSRHNGSSYKIYKRILTDNPADIKAKIKARWAQIKNGPLSPANMNSKLEYYGNQQVRSGAEQREINRWVGSEQYDFDNVMLEVAYIKDWYAKRWAKMDRLINGGELDKTDW
ncbi:MAG: CotH kinase family protein [Dysgonomonas sp.]